MLKKPKFIKINLFKYLENKVFNLNFSFSYDLSLNIILIKRRKRYYVNNNEIKAINRKGHRKNAPRKVFTLFYL